MYYLTCIGYSSPSIDAIHLFFFFFSQHAFFHFIFIFLYSEKIMAIDQLTVNSLP
jgi:hypothetical protein